MDPIFAINTALTSLRTATEIVRLVTGADASLEKADLKLKLAAIVEALAEAKSQIADVKNMVTEKDETIARLQEALDLKGKMIPLDSAYWLTDEQSNVTDGPFCANCYDTDRVKRRLVCSKEHPFVQCPKCKVPFPASRVHLYLKKPPKEAYEFMVRIRKGAE